MQTAANASQSTRPAINSADLELQRNIDDGLNAMAMEAGENLENGLKEGPFSAENQEVLRSKYHKSMQNIQEIATERFHAELEHERERRRQTAGQAMRPEGIEAREKNRRARGRPNDRGSSVKPPDMGLGRPSPTPPATAPPMLVLSTSQHSSLLHTLDREEREKQSAPVQGPHHATGSPSNNNSQSNSPSPSERRSAPSKPIERSGHSSSGGRATHSPSGSISITPEENVAASRPHVNVRRGSAVSLRSIESDNFRTSITSPILEQPSAPDRTSIAELPVPDGPALLGLPNIAAIPERTDDTPPQDIHREKGGLQEVDAARGALDGSREGERQIMVRADSRQSSSSDRGRQQEKQPMASAKTTGKASARLQDSPTTYQQSPTTSRSATPQASLSKDSRESPTQSPLAGSYPVSASSHHLVVPRTSFTREDGYDTPGSGPSSRSTSRSSSRLQDPSYHSTSSRTSHSAKDKKHRTYDDRHRAPSNGSDTRTTRANDHGHAPRDDYDDLILSGRPHHSSASPGIPFQQPSEAPMPGLSRGSSLRKEIRNNQAPESPEARGRSHTVTTKSVPVTSSKWSPAADKPVRLAPAPPRAPEAHHEPKCMPLPQRAVEAVMGQPSVSPASSYSKTSTSRNFGGRMAKDVHNNDAKDTQEQVVVVEQRDGLRFGEEGARQRDELVEKEEEVRQEKAKNQDERRRDETRRDERTRGGRKRDKEWREEKLEGERREEERKEEERRREAAREERRREVAREEEEREGERRRRKEAAKEEERRKEVAKKEEEREEEERRRRVERRLEEKQKELERLEEAKEKEWREQEDRMQREELRWEEERQRRESERRQEDEAQKEAEERRIREEIWRVEEARREAKIIQESAAQRMEEAMQKVAEALLREEEISRKEELAQEENRQREEEIVQKAELAQEEIRRREEEIMHKADLAQEEVRRREEDVKRREDELNRREARQREYERQRKEDHQRKENERLQKEEGQEQQTTHSSDFWKSFRRERERLEEERRTQTKAMYAIHDRQWSRLTIMSELRWDSFPWPTLDMPSTPVEITAAAIRGYILSPDFTENTPPRPVTARLDEYIQRWHPNHLSRGLLAKVVETDRETVLEGAWAVIIGLKDILREETQKQEEWKATEARLLEGGTQMMAELARLLRDPQPKEGSRCEWGVKRCEDEHSRHDAQAQEIHEAKYKSAYPHKSPTSSPSHLVAAPLRSQLSPRSTLRGSWLFALFGSPFSPFSLISYPSHPHTYTGDLSEGPLHLKFPKGKPYKAERARGSFSLVRLE
ncbi:hypothetical protein BD779DRAFT_1675549 [Infundibulicybe gibba]|nr:hypothetical protein BD779DRAFT_1675549 [Infundibulicybe gibba]